MTTDPTTDPTHDPTDPTTGASGGPGTGDEGRSGAWRDDAEAAIAEVRRALQAAWEESRDARGSALEAAKVAARQLGEAIDQGIGAARQQWERARTDEATAAGSATSRPATPTEPAPPTGSAAAGTDVPEPPPAPGTTDPGTPPGS